VKINNAVRTIESALSVTKNSGTTWFNASANETNGKEIDWFVYLIWNTTPATDIMDIGFARIPYARVAAEFSTTNTNEKYLAHANASEPNGNDDVAVIGRFAATLTASGGNLWSVPTYNGANLIQGPIYETRVLDYVSTKTPQAGGMTNIVITYEKYQIVGRELKFFIWFTWEHTTAAANYIQVSLPFTPGVVANFAGLMNNGASPVASNVGGSGAGLFVRRYDAATGVYTVGTARDIRMSNSCSLVTT